MNKLYLGLLSESEGFVYSWNVQIGKIYATPSGSYFFQGF